MPNAELAARIRTAILTRPRHYDSAAWLRGTSLLHPDTPLGSTSPLSRTTLCVAG
ncbi:hypothetical protein ABZ379_06800 [Streptomyces canus]|uniref:hypothetical protein n=1 Tax=Streptomyces canus TaxID=58343 RepID=UPI0033C1E63C